MLSIDTAQAVCLLIILTINGKILGFNQGRKNTDESKLNKVGNWLQFSLIAVLAISAGHQEEGIVSDTM